jgi:hypothetical protein
MESSSGTDSYTYNHTEPDAYAFKYTDANPNTPAFGYANADSEAQECRG